MRILPLPIPDAAFANRPASREERDLFSGGPLLGRFQDCTLKMSARTFRLAGAAVALGWLPLCMLAALQSLITGDGSLHSFLTDYGALARSLVAAPLLILGQAVVAPRLGAIVRYFREAGLVRTADVSRYYDIVRSTRRLRDSVIAEILIAIAGFVLAATFWTVPPPFLPLWHHTAAGTVSAASWWHQFVSLPILMLLMLSWLWRLVLWTRFLWKVSRLDLLLIPSHPDGAAGLKFLGMSLEALALPAFALACVLAGPLANRVVHGGAAIATFRAPVLAFVVTLLLLLAGPLLLFADRLLAAMQNGVLGYGAMARDLGMRLESRWLRKSMTDASLDANDFSATTDLYSIVANVYTMNIVPLSIRNLAVIVMATLLPFVPVLMFAISPIALLKKLGGFILVSAALGFSVEATASTHFAWLNTRLSMERTFMAWIRTAVSLISFGFTIVQFFQRLSQTQDTAARPLNPGAPRILGLALIGVGLLCLIISSWQYRQGVNYMWQAEFGAVAGIGEKPLRSPAMLAALVLMLIGLFAFLSVFVRLT